MFYGCKRMKLENEIAGYPNYGGVPQADQICVFGEVFTTNRHSARNLTEVMFGVRNSRAMGGSITFTKPFRKCGEVIWFK